MKNEEEYQVNVIDSNKELLENSEDQIELLRDIKAAIYSSAGSGGLGIADIIGLKLGHDALKQVFSKGKIGKLATSANSIKNKLFSNTLSSTKQFASNLSGSLRNMFVNTGKIVTRSTSTVVTKAGGHVANMSTTILNSIKGLAASVSLLFKSSMSGAGKLLSTIGFDKLIKGGVKGGLKLIGKVATPIIGAYGGYTGYQNANKIDSGNKLSTTQKVDAGIAGAIDSILFGAPEYFTGKSLSTRSAERALLNIERMEEITKGQSTMKSPLGHAKDLFNWITGEDNSKPSGKRPFTETLPGRGNRNRSSTTSFEEAADNFDADVNSPRYLDAMRKEAYRKSQEAGGAITPSTNVTTGYLGITRGADTVENMMQNLSSTSSSTQSKARESVLDAGMRRVFRAMQNNTKVLAYTTSETTRAVEDGNSDRRKNHRLDRADADSAEEVKNGGSGPSVFNDPSNPMNHPSYRSPNESTGGSQQDGKSVSPTAAGQIGTNTGLFGKSPYNGNMPEVAGPSNAFTSTDIGAYKNVSTKVKGTSSLTGSGANENVKSWYEFLTKPLDQGGLGRTHEQAKGEIASMRGESGSSLDPAAYNPNDLGKPSGGTAQWRGSRLRALKALAAKQGKDWRDRSVQQEFYRQEMLGTHKGANAAITSATTSEEALSAHVRQFERPKYPNKEIGKRKAYLADVQKGAATPAGLISSGVLDPNSIPLGNGKPITPSGPSGFENRIVMANKGKIRNKDLQESLQDVYNYAAQQAGIDKVVVASGGQSSSRNPLMHKKPGGWTGSTRHDNGGAGDIDLWKGGRKLDFTNPDDRPYFENFIRESSRAGATGVGAGASYMGKHRIHVGYGSEATWGSEKSWISKAMEEGRAGRKDFNMEAWKKGQVGVPARVVSTKPVKVEDTSDPKRKPMPTYNEMISNKRDKPGFTADKALGLVKTKTSSAQQMLSSNVGNRLGLKENIVNMRPTEVGKLIGKGMGEYGQDRVKAPSLSSVQSMPSPFEPPARKPANSVAQGRSSSGESNKSNDTVPNPSGIPHTDELAMLMANSQFMA